jgi:hypothetical protein
LSFAAISSASRSCSPAFCRRSLDACCAGDGVFLGLAVATATAAAARSATTEPEPAHGVATRHHEFLDLGLDDLHLVIRRAEIFLQAIGHALAPVLAAARRRAAAVVAVGLTAALTVAAGVVLCHRQRREHRDKGERGKNHSAKMWVSCSGEKLTRDISVTMGWQVSTSRRRRTYPLCHDHDHDVGRPPPGTAGATWPMVTATGAAATGAARAAVPLAFAEPFLVLGALIRIEHGFRRLDGFLKIRAHLEIERLGLLVVVGSQLVDAGFLFGRVERLDFLVALATELAAAICMQFAAAIGHLRPDLLQLRLLLGAEVQQRIELALAALPGRRPGRGACNCCGRFTPTIKPATNAMMKPKMTTSLVTVLALPHRQREVVGDPLRGIDDIVLRLRFVLILEIASAASTRRPASCCSCPARCDWR